MRLSWNEIRARAAAFAREWADAAYEKGETQSFSRAERGALLMGGVGWAAGEWIGPGGPRRLQNGRLVASAARGGFDSHALPPDGASDPAPFRRRRAGGRGSRGS